MSDTCILEAARLNKAYGRRRVIDDLDLHIQRGDIYGFLGPNGAGKTTTIRMLMGLVRHDSGNVSINGFDIRRDFKRAIRKVGAVVETPKFFENYSAYANLQMTRNYYKGIPKGKIDEVLEITGIGSRAHDKVKTYSLGMKQRLGIARALIHEPDLVILDEPTNGLDPQGMKEIREMILLLAREKKITFFISTHLLNEVEMTCNKVGIIKHGKKVVEGYVKDLLAVDYEVVEVFTDNAPKALELARKLPFVMSAELLPQGFRAQIGRGSSIQLIKLLVEGGFAVQYLIPHKQSLEEYFMEATKGGEHIV